MLITRRRRRSAPIACTSWCCWRSGLRYCRSFRLNVSFSETDFHRSIHRAAAVFLSPRICSVPLWSGGGARTRWRQVERTRRENGLKSVFLARIEFAVWQREHRGWPVAREGAAQSRRVVRDPSGTASAVGWGNRLLTEQGQIRAGELERNYRLWEHFLTNEVNLPIDHTQRDAENIEHILGPELVRELEAKYDAHHA